MRWTDTRGAWDRFDSFKAKYKNFEICVAQRMDLTYYFTLNREVGDIRYNSLWDNTSFSTLEEAQNASVKWIDEKVKQGVSTP